MKAIKPLLLSLSMLALACSAAYAADDAKNKSAQAKPATPQSSASTGASGGASSGTSAKYDFDKADKNKDGRLSRAEFDEMLKGSASAGASAKKDDQSQAKTGSKMGDKPGTPK